MKCNINIVFVPITKKKDAKTYLLLAPDSLTKYKRYKKNGEIA